MSAPDSVIDESARERGTTRDRYLKKSAAAALGARGISTIGLLLVTPILAGRLGAEGYGILATLLATSNILGVADFGVANGLISKVAAAGWGSAEAQRLVSGARAVLAMASALGLAAAAAAAALLPWSEWIHTDVLSPVALRWAAFGALAGTALSLSTGLGQRIDLARQRGHAVATWAAVSGFSGPTSAALGSMFTTDLVLIVCLAALSPSVVLAAETFRAVRSVHPARRPKLTHATRSSIAAVLSSGAPFVGLGLVIAVSYQADTLIVSAVAGSVAAAQFSVVMRLFTLVSGTVQSAMNQLWSAFADAIASGDSRWIRTTLIRSVLTSGALVVAVNAVLVLGSTRIIAVWLGEDFVPSRGLVVGAALWTAYTTINHPIVMYINGAQLQRLQLLAAVPMGFANVLLSLALAHRYGAVGPLIGSLVAHVVINGGPMTVVALRHIAAATPSGTAR